MKKVIYVISAIAALIFAASCEKESNVSNINEPTNEGFVTYTFTATNAEEEVRSSLSNAGVFSWGAGDHIAIYNSATSSYVDFEVKSVDESGNATIKADAAAGAVWTNAIYPAARAAGSGDEVDYTVSTVSGPILVSKVNGQELSFKYLGAVVNVQVNSLPDTPSTITFTANSEVFGSRSFSWNGESPVLGGSGSTASITVPFASGVVSIPVPQASYAGFTLTVDNEAGRHLYVKTTANTFNLSAKKLLPMPALTYAAPTKFYVTTSSSGSSWNKSQVRMLQTDANKYMVCMNCGANCDIYIFDEYNYDNGTVGYLNKGKVTDANLYKISWDSSSSKGGPEYAGGIMDKPFYNNDFPVDNMCISAGFNSWGVGDKFTYNGNMYWVIENKTIAAGTYEFKIRKADSANWYYAAGVNSGLGSDLYGSLKGDADNASVTLAAGKYNIYLNSTTDWYYDIMFEKL